MVSACKDLGSQLGPRTFTRVFFGVARGSRATAFLVLVLHGGRRAKNYMAYDSYESKRFSRIKAIDYPEQLDEVKMILSVSNPQIFNSLVPVDISEPAALCVLGKSFCLSRNESYSGRKAFGYPAQIKTITLIFLVLHPRTSLEKLLMILQSQKFSVLSALG